MTKQRVYSHERGLRILKSGVNFDDYKSRYPSAIKVKKVPSMATLEKWVNNGVCQSVDGCQGIEPDGTCKHGYPSWLIVLGYV